MGENDHPRLDTILYRLENWLMKKGIINFVSVVTGRRVSLHNLSEQDLYMLLLLFFLLCKYNSFSFYHNCDNIYSNKLRSTKYLS